jgi:hypothetical protein
MPGTYCRGCGKSKQDLNVDDPRQCPDDGPILSSERRFCEHCGHRLHFVGQEPCPACAKKAYKFFGR